MRQRSPLRLAVVLCAVLATVTAGASAVAAPVRHSAPASLVGSRDVHYAVNEPMCSAPGRSDRYTCNALRRVTVPKGTPGAYRYRTAYSTGPAGGLTPADLATAYDYNPKLNRSHQTVALVNWYDDPHALSDLNRFDAHYGFARETSRSFRKVDQAGKAKPLPRRNRESAGEISLDIETVRSVCRSCRILLVEAQGPTDDDLAAAENTAARLGATEISNSYGSVEHKVSAKVRKAFDHPGIVITASTGDEGWDNWDVVNDGVRSPGRASYPSTDPHVIAVGGTTLNLNSNGTRSSETVWDSNGADDTTGVVERGALGASGGGCSKFFSAASWQRRQAGYVASKCGGKRLAADVSADADPSSGFDVLNTFHRSGYTNWMTVGGTSLSSPLVAAMYALAGGAHHSAYPAASAYVNAEHRSSTRYDVTSGGNGFCGGDDTTTCSAVLASETRPSTNNPNGFGGGNTDCSYPRNKRDVSAAPAQSPECNARTGYDGPSGVGTPRSDALFRATNPTVTIKAPKHPREHHSVFLTARTIERVSGLHPVRFSWRFGDGHPSSGKRPGVRHTFTSSGRYRVQLQVTDSSGQITIVTSTVRVR